MALLRPFCLPKVALFARPQTLSRQLVHTVAAASARDQRMSQTEGQRAVWNQITDTYEKAQNSGAASKYKTHVETLTDRRVPIKFVLRVSESLRDKPKPPKSREEQKDWKNPFQPYDEALYVADLSATHHLLLNKFNVVAHHVLVVTKQFESQTDALNLQDMEATWHVVQAIPQGALAYFNCGPESGASQPHKHVQVVPLPLADDPAVIPSPIGTLMDEAWQASQLQEGDIASVQQLPYQNYFSKISTSVNANKLISIYKALLGKCSPGTHPPTSYNVILSKDHMLLVPRRKENIGSVGINALGFAGTVLVNSKDGLQFIHDEGPISILEAAGVPWQQSPP